MHRLRNLAQDGRGLGGVADLKPPKLLVDVVLWACALALISPLVLYAGAQTMPLSRLFSVAAGIALALGLAGRELHAVLLDDVLSGPGRRGKARRALAASMILLIMLLVLVGLAVVFLVLRRGVSPSSFGTAWGT